MTENRKRISVAIQNRSREVEVRAIRPVRKTAVVISMRAVKVATAETYDGTYSISPKFRTQVFPTKDKVMTDDLTVSTIYVGDTSNPAGGVTIFIGGEFIG